MKWKLLSHVWLFVTPWTLAFQCPLSMKFSGIMEWFAIPFSRRSFWPRGQIQVSCITGRFFIIWATREAGEVAQSCLTLCDPMDCGLPGSSIQGILQARILEWVAISFSRGSSQPRDQIQVSCIGGRRFNLWDTREDFWSFGSALEQTRSLWVCHLACRLRIKI